MSRIGHRRMTAAAEAFADAIAEGNHSLRQTAFVHALRVAMSLDCENGHNSARSWSDSAILSLVREPYRVDEPDFIPNDLSEKASRKRVSCEIKCCVAVGSRFRWYCSGTVVGPNVVVTAGHAFDQFDPQRVFVGNHCHASGTGQVIPVRKCTRHPNYSRRNFRHDIMVLKLAEDLPEDSIGQLAPPGSIEKNTICQAVGFGDFSCRKFGIGKKTKIEVPILKLQDREVARQRGYDPNFEFVAGGPPTYADGRSGDSGGPLQIQYGGKWRVAGICSRSVLTKDPKLVSGMGGIYLRLDKYQKFIESAAATK